MRVALTYSLMLLVGVAAAQLHTTERIFQNNRLVGYTQWDEQARPVCQFGVIGFDSIMSAISVEKQFFHYAPEGKYEVTFTGIDELDYSRATIRLHEYPDAGEYRVFEYISPISYPWWGLVSFSGPGWYPLVVSTLPDTVPLLPAVSMAQISLFSWDSVWNELKRREEYEVESHQVQRDGNTIVCYSKVSVAYSEYRLGGISFPNGTTGCGIMYDPHTYRTCDLDRCEVWDAKGRLVQTTQYQGSFPMAEVYYEYDANQRLCLEWGDTTLYTREFSATPAQYLYARHVGNGYDIYLDSTDSVVYTRTWSQQKHAHHATLAYSDGTFNKHTTRKRRVYFRYAMSARDASVQGSRRFRWRVDKEGNPLQIKEIRRLEEHRWTYRYRVEQT